MADVCTNCGAGGADDYCSRCGQSQHDPRRKLSVLLVDLLDELSLTGRIFTTLRVLLTRPGRLTTEWVEGRRAPYMSPVRLYILASVVFFSSAFFLGAPWDERPPSLADLGLGFDAAPGELADAVISARLQTLLTFGVLLLVPLVALVLRAVFARAGYLLVDHLVFSLHVHSFTLLAFAAMYGLVSLFGLDLPPAATMVVAGVALAILVSPAAYIIAALGRVYGRVGWSRIWRAVVTVGIWVVAVGQLAGSAFRSSESMARRANAEFELVVARHDYLHMRDALQAGDSTATRRLADRSLQAFLDARAGGAELLADDLYYLATIHAQRGDSAMARETVAAALRRNPEHAFARAFVERLAADRALRERSDSAGRAPALPKP